MRRKLLPKDAIVYSEAASTYLRVTNVRTPLVTGLLVLLVIIARRSLSTLIR